MTDPAPDPAEAAATDLDVLIVGAGLSGIGMAAHLQDHCPHKRFAILESRDAIGGTWDLFRYPGVRSDSDMHTLGYAFKPWTGADAIADGASILDYIRTVAAERDLVRHIRFGHRVTRADWSSADARWTVRVERGDGAPVTIRCNFLLMCSGYYSYDAGYRPSWPGEARFGGRFVHPQHWPADLDWSGKQVVVIGSGATAVTLVPALARAAAHVTMLQRSPTYVVARPSVDRVATRLARLLPAHAAYAATRWKNVLLGQFFYRLARARPALVRKRIVAMARKALGPGHDVDRHFTPSYDPWDQRICAVPDADLFAALRDGRAEVVTDTIAGFTETGIETAGGRTIPADIVVTATGLVLNVAGDVAFAVDGVPVDLARTMNYKGCMLSGLPNLATVFGYTNASWTLKADLIGRYVCRLLNRMDARGLPVAVPVRDPAVAEVPFVDFSSGYVRRAAALLPSQGSRAPWRLHQNYLRDRLMFARGRIEDGTLVLAPAGPPVAALARTAAEAA